MSMVKILEPNAETFGDAVVELIKIGSRGRLIGHDRSEFEKRASSRILHDLDQIKFAKGELPIHLLAVGATEYFGNNRNGDGFKEANCRRTHNTFVKQARFYRDHLNKDPSKSYGTVKESMYNEDMHRIELICALNETKEAAENNGGLVADRELEKLAKHAEIPVSMACRVAFDVCSYCNNKAPTRKQYCDDIEYGGTCKAGGLKRNMGRAVMVDGDVHQLHADNPDPKFFDISHVFRPADRIAYVTGTLQKAASHGRTVSGAELAELLGVTTPHYLLTSGDLPARAASQLKLAAQLAGLEQTIKLSSSLLGFCGSVQDGVTFPTEARTKFACVLKALADARCLLPVRDFIRLVTDYDEKQAAAVAPIVQAHLPGVYDRLTSRDDFEQLLTANPYNPAPAAPEQLKHWAAKQAAAISLEEPWLTRRVQLAAIRGQELPLLDNAVADKLAAAEGPAKELANHYALYKLAFLDEISSPSADLPLTATVALLQNYAN